MAKTSEEYDQSRVSHGAVRKVSRLSHSWMAVTTYFEIQNFCVCIQMKCKNLSLNIVGGKVE